MKRRLTLAGMWLSEPRLLNLRHRSGFVDQRCSDS